MTRPANPIEEAMPLIEMEPALDLGRPELRAVMNRYTGTDPARSETSIFGPPSALVVTRAAGQEAELKESIESHGWFVKTCRGPGATPCPLMRGEPCSLRESVDAAVVFVEPDHAAGGTRMIPRLRCAADSASPGVVALEGRLDDPQFTSGTAIIGARRGPDAILEALRKLLTRVAEDRR